MPTQMACRYLSRGKPRGIKPTPSNKKRNPVLYRTSEYKKCKTTIAG
jgi:hypothetical protein